MWRNQINLINRNKSLQRKYLEKNKKPQESETSSDTGRISSESDDDILCVSV
jgi:hypothetical protein